MALRAEQAETPFHPGSQTPFGNPLAETPFLESFNRPVNRATPDLFRFDSNHPTPLARNEMAWIGAQWRAMVRIGVHCLHRRKGGEV
jgi:hypothetical protein